MLARWFRWLGRYFRWLHGRWPAGEVEPLPVVGEDGATDVPGLYVVGDLTGIPLLKFALDTGARAVRRIAADLGPGPRPLRGGSGVDLVDVAIVGGGVAGMAAAAEARASGLTFVVVEGAEPFSTIANFPKAKPIFTYPTGMMPAGEVQVGADVKEALLEELRAQAKGIETVRARALGIRRAEGRLEVDLEGAPPVRARAVVVAVGRAGAMRRLGVPGEDRPQVFNRLHDPADFAGRRVVVVGGGDTAAETAVALARAGADVTIVYRGDVLCRPKPENLSRVEALATCPEPERRLRVRLSSSVSEIREDAVVVEGAAGTEDLPADAVFVLIGRAAPLDFLRRSGVRIRGEWTRGRIAACALFVAAIAALVDWKSGGPLADAFRERGFFPFFLRDAWAEWFRPEAADSLAGVVARSAQYPGFWYTLLYSSVVTVWGVRRIRRRRTPYVTAQTSVLVAIQVVPLFLLPEIVLPWLDRNGLLARGLADSLFPEVAYGNGREYWRAYGFVLAWPLSVYNVFTERPLGAWLWISFFQTFVLIPAIVWRWGKGAYCGWICSCGALAETLGDAHREKMPHGRGWNRLNMLGQLLLAIAAAMLVLRVVGWLQPPGSAVNRVFRVVAMPGWKWGVDVGLGGVLGLGLYFWLSGRTWCRFACPLAALMHVYARLGRFAILADKKKCISCGVCTAVCHQGIDVMHFAQRGLPMTDPQCVRCSACVSSCPTGTLEFGLLDAAGRPAAGERLAASAVRMAERDRPALPSAR